MQYERVQALVKQFQEDKYVLRAYGKIYALNRCKAYRSVRVEDVERRRRARGEGSPDEASGKDPDEGSGKHAAERSGEEDAKLQGIIQIVNKTLYHYTDETLNRFSENDEQLAKLYSQIDQCSTLCQEVDTVLTNHKNELTYISSDINEIQTITETMTHKLKNRRVTLELLNTYIKIILVTPQLICDICNGNINEQFVENVKILTKKLENCEHCLFDSYPSIRSSYVELQKLKNKAIDRIHRFFRNSIHDIESKRSNVHFVQQHLGRFYELNSFLYNNCKEAYTYLVKEYVTIMNRTYYNLFRSYMHDLEKKKVEFNGELTIGWTGNHVDSSTGGSDFRMGRNDPLSDPSNWQSNRANFANPHGEGTTSQSDSLVPGINANLSLLSAKNKMMNMLGFGSKGGVASQDRKESLFPLSKRTSVLLDLAYYPGGGSDIGEAVTLEAATEEADTVKADTAALPTAAALPIIFTTDSRPHFFEAIYKSISKLFVDTGTAEYLFLSNFFRNYENHDFLFLYVYAKTLSLHFDFLYYYLSETFDFIALFCIYMINLNNGCLTKRRGIAPLYEFIHRIQNLIWNRIDYIVSENVRSVTVHHGETSRMERRHIEMAEQRNIPLNHPHQKSSLYNLFHLNSAQTGSTYLNSGCLTPSNGYALHGGSSTTVRSTPPNGVFTTSSATHLGPMDQGEAEEATITRIAPLQCASSQEGISQWSRHTQGDGAPPYRHAHPVVKRFSDFYCSLVVLTKLSLHLEKEHHVKMCCGVVSSGERGSPPKKKTPPSTTLGAHSREEMSNRGEPLPGDQRTGKGANSSDSPNGSDNPGGDLQEAKRNINVKSRSDETDSPIGLTDGGGERTMKECNEGKEGHDPERTPKQCEESKQGEDPEHSRKESAKTAQQTKGDQDHPIEKKYSHLNDLIGRLEENIIDVLAVHKNQFPHTRDQLLFLINNYCHMIHVMRNNRIEEDKIDRFDQLLKKEMNAYVEFQLNHYATDLILFVSKHEQIVDKLKKDGYCPSDFTSEVDAKLMESVAIQFTKNWKDLFKNIKQEVTLSFPHTDTSAQILKMLNTQILLYFTRFHQLLKGFFARVQPPPCVESLPSVDVVLVQIKKDAKGGINP
ncbi:hypothetical protein C922_00021 [Plasmodium inui San Antonio 1]|uniref:Vacuolar protein sorting-associated protein 52 n=1 Tax=Plasmodium inui San Antonio 1 TaxID=1237626 RepID=W7ACX3_9APIC|nr:hypothetical protein C922_00021 [Plasmodium inui San Antonio 1]EUD69158.1 hypothetical protein C922_00021 [Plasmodium inui San Antonio 1]